MSTAMIITYAIKTYEEHNGDVDQDVTLWFDGICSFSATITGTTKEFWFNMLNQKNHTNISTRDRIVVKNGMITFYLHTDPSDLNQGDIAINSMFSLDFNTFKDTIVEIYNELQ
jgi:hypothetical protein